jgi:hypothetical protein
MSADLHDLLRAARRQHQRAECALASLLFTLKCSRRYLERGHATVEAYAEAELDLGVRQTRDLIAVGRRLEELPIMAAAFAEGRLSHTKAREIARVATPETDADWTARACAWTSRTLERAVAGAAPGAPPPPPDAPLPLAPARQTLRFEVDAAEAEVIRAALAQLRVQGGFGPDVGDGALLAEFARAASARSTPDADADAAEAEAPSAPRYRVVLTRCADCHATHMGRGDTAAVASARVQAEAACDAQHLDLSRPGGRLTQAIPPATRRRVLERDAHRCAVPHCRNRLWLDLHHIRPRSLGGDHRAENLICLCPTHHGLIHDGRLFLHVDADTRSVHFALPTGELLGARRDAAAGSPGVEAALASVLRALSAGGGALPDVAHRSGHPRGETAVALETLQALGRVVTAPDGTFYDAGGVFAGALG